MTPCRQTGLRYWQPRGDYDVLKTAYTGRPSGGQPLPPRPLRHNHFTDDAFKIKFNSTGNSLFCKVSYRIRLVLASLANPSEVELKALNIRNGVTARHIIGVTGGNILSSVYRQFRLRL